MLAALGGAIESGVVDGAADGGVGSAWAIEAGAAGGIPRAPTRAQCQFLACAKSSPSSPSNTVLASLTSAGFKW